jgi:hypothetical protein
MAADVSPAQSLEREANLGCQTHVGSTLSLQIGLSACEREYWLHVSLAGRVIWGQ